LSTLVISCQLGPIRNEMRSSPQPPRSR
jgi:hypothetical protein